MKKLFILVAITIFLSPILGFCGTNELKVKLFRNTDFLLNKAKEMNCGLLAPNDFSKAIKYYQKAEEKFNSGDKEVNIKGDLYVASDYFKSAIKTAELAELTFKTTLKGRKQAIDSESKKYEYDTFLKAEKKFNSAVEELEKGDLKDAKSEASEAEQLYKTAELGSIKKGMFNNTVKLQESAEELKVKKYSPKTLHDSQLLLSEAEKELDINRYDTENKAGKLLKQAEIQAEHSIYLTKEIKNVKDKVITMEELLLKTEEPLIKIGESIDLSVRFNKGYELPTEAIIKKINEYQNTIVSLKKNIEELIEENNNHQNEIKKSHEEIAQLTEKLSIVDSQLVILKEKEKSYAGKDLEIVNLNKSLVDLKLQLGDNDKEQAELKQKIEKQKKIEAKFKSVEKMFNPSIAQVFRQGDTIIIRLVGLSFDSGKANIKPEYFTLLGTVQNAIRTFENCSVDIEGHTDNKGNDKINLELSTKRADAVRQYILANTDLDVTKVKAMGYGKEKPAASNDSAEGRAKNRRIDVVINPLF